MDAADRERQGHTDHQLGMVWNVVRNTTVQIAGQVLSKVASLALYIVVARQLGVTLFGDLVFALSISTLMTSLANFGIEGILVRGIARDNNEAGRLLSRAIVLKIAFGALGAAAAVGVSFVAGYKPDVRAAVAILSIGSVIDLITNSYYAIFQALGDLRPPSVCLVVQRSITAGVGIPLVLLGAGVTLLSLAFFGASAATFVLAAMWLARRGVVPNQRPTLGAVRSLAVASFPLGVNNIFSTVLFRADATMLALIKGSFAVGLYGVAYRLLESTLFIPYALSSALMPVMARLRRGASAARVYELGNAVLALILVPIGDFFVAFPHLIVHTLYGSQYQEADTVMRLLGGAAVLYGFAYLAAVPLVLRDRDRVLPWVNGIAAAQNIGMNLVLIPTLSYNGAAISTTACEATRTVLLMWYAIRAVGPIRLGRIMLAPAIGTAAIAGVVLVAGVGIVGFVLAALAYLACVAAIELFFFPADARMLRGALARRRLPQPTFTNVA
jgi:O-antigen/teichoic acid export membrane protein